MTIHDPQSLPLTLPLSRRAPLARGMRERVAGGRVRVGFPFPLLAFTLHTLLFTTTALWAAGCGTTTDAPEPARKGKWIDMALEDGRVIQAWVTQLGMETVPELRDWPESENPPDIPESEKSLPPINLDAFLHDADSERAADEQNGDAP